MSSNSLTTKSSGLRGPRRRSVKRIAVVFVAMSASLVGFAGTGIRPAVAETYITFQSPSGNAHCSFSLADDGSGYARCELREFTGKVPPRPKDCDLDWVPQAAVDQRGRVTVFGCQGDTSVNPGSPKLAYGKSMKSGPFTCTSAVTGITCKVKSGRGFLVSKAAIKKL